MHGHRAILALSRPGPVDAEAPGRAYTREELLAAAHASCFSMAFSARLAKNGTPAERLDVRADVTFDKTDAGWGVASSRLSVRGKVPGIDAARFAEAVAGYP